MFNIDATTATEWLIGAASVTAELHFYNHLGNADLTTAAGAAVVCTSQVNSPLPSTLVMNAGKTNNLASNGACGPIF